MTSTPRPHDPASPTRVAALALGLALSMSTLADAAIEGTQVTEMQGGSGMFYQFGKSVSISGDQAAIGSSFGGAVSIRERNTGGPDAWGEVASITH
ncbi:MAG: hypothetical protein AAF533_30605, partial [Acidobacteriota bacterium]